MAYSPADFREMCTVKDTVPATLLVDVPCQVLTERMWFRNPYCDVAFVMRYDEATVTAYQPSEGYYTVDYKGQHYSVLALLIADQGKHMVLVTCPLMP